MSRIPFSKFKSVFMQDAAVATVGSKIYVGIPGKIIIIEYLDVDTLESVLDRAYAKYEQYYDARED